MTTKKDYKFSARKINGLWIGELFKLVNGNPLQIHNCFVKTGSRNRAIENLKKTRDEFIKLSRKLDLQKELVRFNVNLLESKNLFPMEDMAVMEGGIFISHKDANYFFRGDVRKVLKKEINSVEFLEMCEKI